MAKPTLIVIGAGIVGLACAVEAQRRGKQVTIIDRAEPGFGCSFGNAGIIAVSEIFPLITPTRVMSLPRMMFNSEAPAVIRAASLPQFLPWMLRAATYLTPARQQKIIEGLLALNVNALPAWRSLLAHCNALPLLREKGMIRLIRDERNWSELKKIQDALLARTLPSRMLNRDELRELEPYIGNDVVGGLLHESDADIGDPLSVSIALANTIQAGGGNIIKGEVIALVPTESAIDVSTKIGTHYADQILITTGLEAGSLLGPLGITVPLQAERGYHLMLSNSAELLNRPVTFQQESCVATPMGNDLRLAGTVEFANSDAVPNWFRAQSLATHAARYFNTELSLTGAQQWIGSRPSLPDSLPAIGRLPRDPRIGYAFGHQHLGVTQAAISAMLLNQIIDGEIPKLDCQPYSIERFAKH